MVVRTAADALDRGRNHFGKVLPRIVDPVGVVHGREQRVGAAFLPHHGPARKQSVTTVFGETRERLRDRTARERCEALDCGELGLIHPHRNFGQPDTVEVRRVGGARYRDGVGRVIRHDLLYFRRETFGEVAVQPLGEFLLLFEPVGFVFRSFDFLLVGFAQNGIFQAERMFAVEPEADAHRLERYARSLLYFREVVGYRRPSLGAGQRIVAVFEQVVVVADFTHENYQRQRFRGVETVESEHVLFFEIHRNRCVEPDVRVQSRGADDPLVSLLRENNVVEVAVADRQRNTLFGGFFRVRIFGPERREPVVAGTSRDDAERGG